MWPFSMKVKPMWEVLEEEKRKREEMRTQGVPGYAQEGAAVPPTRRPEADAQQKPRTSAGDWGEPPSGVGGPIYKNPPQPDFSNPSTSWNLWTAWQAEAKRDGKHMPVPLAKPEIGQPDKPDPRITADIWRMKQAERKPVVESGREPQQPTTATRQAPLQRPADGGVMGQRYAQNTQQMNDGMTEQEVYAQRHKIDPVGGALDQAKDATLSAGRGPAAQGVGVLKQLGDWLGYNDEVMETQAYANRIHDNAPVVRHAPELKGWEQEYNFRLMGQESDVKMHSFFRDTVGVPEERIPALMEEWKYNKENLGKFLQHNKQK